MICVRLGLNLLCVFALGGLLEQKKIFMLLPTSLPGDGKSAASSSVSMNLQLQQTRYSLGLPLQVVILSLFRYRIIEQNHRII